MASNNDPFLRIAITFILGVVLGFTLFLMGFIFLFVALLTSSTTTNEIPTWIWIVLGVVSTTIGSWLMYYLLKGSPQPGQYPTH